MKNKILVLFLLVSLFFVRPVAAAAFEPYESYNYDSRGEAVPSQDGYTPECTFSGQDIGAGSFSEPSDIFIAADGLVYIADKGNNRIVSADADMNSVREIYTEFTMPDGSLTELKAPSGIYVSEELIYIADTENERILVSNFSREIQIEIKKPDSESYDRNKQFLPLKVIADSAGNIYAIVSSITTGAVRFDADGNFMGFYGANRVEPTAEIIRDYVSSMFSGEEKLSYKERKIPSGITGFDISGSFIFTCSASSSQTTDVVKKLNAAGENLFAALEVTFGDMISDYDLSEDFIPAKICDLDIDADGNINCLDSRTGRVFQYDSECGLLFIMGTLSGQTGGFEQPCAVESSECGIYVLDSKKNNITLFRETAFGDAVHRAVSLFNGGYYQESMQPWLEVLKRDSGYQRAYAGAAQALLSAEDYSGAMKYARLADMSEIYNKAFQGWRRCFVQEHFMFIASAVIVIIIVAAVLKGKSAIMNLTQTKWMKYTVTHPFDGFEDMRWKKGGSIKGAFIIALLLFFAVLAEDRLYGFQFRSVNDETFNIISYLLRSMAVLGAWTVGNWAVCTLFDGEGTLRNIFIYSAYALTPYIFQLYINVLLSHILIREEAVFMQVIEFTGIIWSGILLFSAVKAVHQYSVLKTAGAILATVAAMLILLFLLILFLSLLQELWNFIASVYTELAYRFCVNK